jgi:3,4-dihydroxy 2-butanone 4-phosphate synthase/GTP cyclohydrolase II
MARCGEPVLVRMQSACIPSDVFAVESCPCEQKKRRALRRIEQAGAGVLVYVHPGQVDLARQVESHIIGHASQPEKTAGLRLELRDFGLGAQVLADLGLRKIRLLTDNPKRIVGLRSFGLEVVEQVSLLDS